MSRAIPIAEGVQSCAAPQARVPRVVLWLQGLTLTWMLAECAVALYAATTARSVALLAFGADSFIELLSASVALMSFIPSFPLTRNLTHRWAGMLLFLLAGVVAVTAAVSLKYVIRPERSFSGIGITIAALVVMPLFACLKRRVARTTGNRALAADAVQSATCAYLAAITLVGVVSTTRFIFTGLIP